MIVDSVNLVREYESIKDEIDAAYHRVIESGKYVLNGEVSLFEKEFANYCQSKFCVGVGNGLDAIRLSLLALGIGPGDEVIVPSYTYIATWLAVSHTGAIPVPVESNIETFNIDTDLIERAITPKTKAIIPVHLYGQPADIAPILEIAENRDLKVIDDAAQAHGSIYNKHKVGSLTDVTAFSFYPTKNLGAIGDGGGITTNDPILYEKLKALRNYGESKKYYNEYVGYNSRLDELQSAFLRVKLKYLDEFNKKKQFIASKFLNHISNEFIVLPYILNCTVPVWHQFVIKSNHRDKLKKYLFEKQIETLVHYPIPPHMQKPYRDIFSYKLEIARKLSTIVLSLPINPTINDEQVDYIIEKINTFKF